jgi:hypothetical protein
VEPPHAGWEVCQVRSGQGLSAHGHALMVVKPMASSSTHPTSKTVTVCRARSAFTTEALPCPVVSVYYEGDASKCDDSSW